MNVLGPMQGVRAIPLAEPKVEHAVGLVAMSREQQSPLISALFAAARTFKP